MAEIVVSSFLSVIFDKLASAALETLAPYLEIKSEIKKLERSLLQIRRVLADASQKEITDPYVKRWLIALQHLAYDIDDILDDLATDAMHHQLTDESETHTSKVRKLFPNPFSKHSSYSMTMKNKIDVITTKLQELIEKKDALGLIVKEETGTSTRSRNINRRLQTSLVHVPNIVGRQAEKEALVHKLLEEGPCDQNFSIVPIVGMGGVGKTTLARLLYQEQQVKDRFEHKAWVCVSDEFDSFGISKVIFQSVTGDNKDFADLNLLQVDLKKHLRGKMFLLVLDDVWSESCEDWETLVGPFHACAPGSKIVMTTRKDQLLKKLGYCNINQLQSLPADDALSLVALHAFGVDNFESHLPLKPHGVGIVKKCDGLPLALKVIGGLLSTKKDEEYWKNLLDNKIWKSHVGGEIVPALILSYYDLSARLKQLFAYCSLFPKDCEFGKEELVQLWVAEEFLDQSTGLTEECLGRECFDELLSRSFFQHSPNDESLFVMHDMMNDLATFVAGELYFRLENETEKDIRKKALEKYRHMSFVREDYTAYKKFEAFKTAGSLRTFLAMSVGALKSCTRFYLSNKILTDLVPQLRLLRVLRLSNFDISEVPESIDTLKHLSLSKLPNDFSRLKNLRHLDMRDTPRLAHMPLGIGELKSLQVLSKVVIGVESGIEITKLKDFKNLGGNISIMGLEKVQNASHAHEADFSHKRLSELEVVWSDVSHRSPNKVLEKEVLDELKPSNDYLIDLKIVSYGGLDFPNWVVDSSFLQLKHVSICYCKNCTSLPPLGQLRSLKELFIEGMDGVEAVGLELLGSDDAFPSLEILSFSNMKRLGKWSTSSRVEFPCLQKLYICNCPKLFEVSLEELPSLNVLRIDKCDRGVLRRLVEVGPSITKLDISYISRLDDEVWRGVLEYLRAVEDLNIGYCSKILYLWESEAVASKVLGKLRNLEVYSCDNLVSLVEKEEEEDNRRDNNLLTSLRMMEVRSCLNMKHFSCPNSIEWLHLNDCTSITAISLPTVGNKLKSLCIWSCSNLLEQEWGGQNINNRSNNMPMLERLEISGWSNLKSFPSLNYLVHLTELRISYCESLELFPDNEVSNLTSLEILEIMNCQSMDASFPRGIWPPNLQSLTIGQLKKPISEWGSPNFPTSLGALTLWGDNGVSSCSQLSDLLPSSLTSLVIREFDKLESVSMGLQHLTSLQILKFWDCPNLNNVSHLQHLTSLKHLSFRNCPNMMYLPEMLLPSLLSLSISNCPILEERCSKKGCYWPIISHIRL